MKTWRMKKALCLLLAAVLMSALLPTPVFAADAEKKSVSGFYMDTIITLTAYTDNEEILNDALKECGRYNAVIPSAASGRGGCSTSTDIPCRGIGIDSRRCLRDTASPAAAGRW